MEFIRCDGLYFQKTKDMYHSVVIDLKSTVNYPKWGIHHPSEEDLQSAFPGNEGAVIPWYGCGMSGTVRIPADRSRLPLAVLQKFLDDWLMDHAGTIDYIHGVEALQNLCSGTDSVGFLLPAVDKDLLFPTVLSDGVLPRKTFSMGEAFDKRYYLEARRIE